MQPEEFKIRRQKLLKELGNNSVAIIFAAKELAGDNQANYPYRQNSDFYYLTGFIEPEAIALFIPNRSDGEFILFNRVHDSTKERWCGAYVGQEGACAKFGADQSFAIAEAEKLLPEFLAGQEKVYFDFGHDRDFDQQVISWINQTRSTRSSRSLPYQLIRLGEILHRLRLKKSPTELANIRQAVAITTAGFLRAMQKCQPGSYEFELAAELLYEFSCQNSREAFTTIVAGGNNACTLHYARNDQQLLAGELVLIDAGAEYEHYCSDISRTFPVDGRFTPEQRAIYEIVFNTQLAVIKEIAPGISWDHLQATAEKVMTAGLKELGLLQGGLDDLLAKQEFKKFFMHKVGHWLGLDTHDVGPYFTNSGESLIIEAGMVFTVEPAIYISSDLSLVADRWLGMGVRVEDDVLVTANGCELLTAKLPKTVDEIEALMRK